MNGFHKSIHLWTNYMQNYFLFRFVVEQISVHKTTSYMQAIVSDIGVRGRGGLL